MPLEDKIIMVTDAATKPECRLSYMSRSKEPESSFIQNPLEGAISRQEFDSRAIVQKKSRLLSL